MGSRYEKERKAFDSWIKKYLKDLTRKLISDPGYRQEFGIYKSFKEDGSYERHPYIKPMSRLDGRVHMLSAVYAGAKTCNYCIAVQRVVLDALEGFEYFWPRREKCAACPGKGQNTRIIMDFFGGTSLPGNVNSAENTWFYVSENSMFNREVSICCGLFDSAFMLEDLLNAVSEKTDKSRLEIVFGGLEALEDIKKYFEEHPPEALDSAELCELSLDGRSPLGDTWSTFCTFRGRSDMDLETRLAAGKNIAFGRMQSVMEVSLEEFYGKIDSLMQMNLKKKDLPKDERNGYAFLLSGLRRWVKKIEEAWIMEGEEQGSMNANPALSVLYYLISGIEMFDHPVLNNGRPAEEVPLFTEVIDRVAEQLGVFDDEAARYLIEPYSPFCSILNTQLASALKLMSVSEAMRGTVYLTKSTMGHECEGIEDFDARHDGICSAMYDILSAFGDFSESYYVDLRSCSFMTLISSFISALSFHGEDEPFCEE